MGRKAKAKMTWENPFADFQIKNKRTAPGHQITWRHKNSDTFSDAKTGEIFDHSEKNELRTFAVGKRKLVDCDAKVSLICDQINSLSELGLIDKVLAAILIAAGRSKTDHCPPDFSACSDSSIRRCLFKLTEADWIARHPTAGRFFINPAKFAGFDRAKKLSEREEKISFEASKTIAEMAIKAAQHA